MHTHSSTSNDPAGRPREPWFLRSRVRLYSVLLLALAIPGAALSGLVAFDVNSELRNQAGRENSLVAAMVARSVQEQFEGLKMYVRSYADRIKFSEAIRDHESGFAQVVLNQMTSGSELISHVIVTDTAGIGWLDSPSEPEVAGQNFSDRDWFQQLSGGDDICISEIYGQNGSGGPHIISIAARMFDPTKHYCGILAAQVTIEDFARWFYGLRLPNDRTVALIDQQGHWLDNKQAAEMPTSLDDTLAFARFLNHSLVDEESADPLTGRQSLISSVPISNAGWNVVASRQLNHVFTPARAIQQSILVYFAVGLAGMLVIGRTMYRLLRRYDDERDKAQERLQRAYADVEDRVRTRTLELTDANRELTRLAAIVESSNDAIASLTLDGIITSVNPAAERIYGFTREEILGRPVSSVVPPGQGVDPATYLQKVAAGESPDPIETIRIRKDGQPFHVSLLVSPIRDESGTVTGVSVISRDITRQKEMEEQSRRLEQERAELLERLQMTLDRMPIGCILNDTEFRFTYWNPAAEKIFGFRLGEVCGKHPFGLITPFESRLHVESVFRRLAEGDHAVDAVGENTTKDGRRITCIWNNTSLRDSQGRFLGVISMCQDVTDQKRDEERMRVYAAALAQNNRELQDLAFVASHDLQEPLRKITAFGERLASSSAATLSDESRDYLDRMQKAAQRMQTLISDLLDFSRVATRAQPFEPTDLQAVVTEVVSDLETRIEQTGGRVQVGALPTIVADPIQMRQLLQNLIANALKFHRPDTAPVVNVSALVMPTESGDGDSCRITVEDNGIGFEMKYADRIFTPFQRLHGRHEFEGTGMGLAICRKIVERHGGSIAAVSTPGRGSSFVVTLPMKQPKTGSTVWLENDGSRASSWLTTTPTIAS